MNLLRRHERKAIGQVKPHLSAEHRVGSYASSVRTNERAIFEDSLFRLSILKNISNKI
jgi:hypothetical protein